MADSALAKKETLRLDVIDESSTKYKDADIIVFNTAHWWTHDKIGYLMNSYILDLRAPFLFTLLWESLILVNYPLTRLLSQKELLPRTWSCVPRTGRVTCIQEGLAHLGQMGRCKHWYWPNSSLLPCIFCKSFQVMNFKQATILKG